MKREGLIIQGAELMVSVGNDGLKPVAGLGP